MTQLTLLPAIVIVLIAAVLGFMLFAPAGTVVKAMNFVGGYLQKGFAAIKGLFGKK